MLHNALYARVVVFIFAFLFVLCSLFATVHSESRVLPSSIMYDRSATRVGFVSEDDQLQAAQGTFSFDYDYLQKYYPKAYTIREQFFAQMTPDDVDTALRSILTMLHDKPWFYFANSADGFDTALYWELILDQCSLLSDFLRRALVSEQGTVFLPIDAGYDEQSYWLGALIQPSRNSGNARSLLSVWKQKYTTTVYEFYAFCFDYLIKMFNEGVLVKNFDQIIRYYSQLSCVAQYLQGSSYESAYQLHIATCKELIAIYKKNSFEESMMRES